MSKSADSLHDDDDDHDDDILDNSLTKPLTSNEKKEMLEEDEDDYDNDSLMDIELMQSGIDLSMPRRRNKYSHALKQMIPFRTDKGPKDELPEATAGLFSLLTYAWLTPIMWKIYKKGTDFLGNIRCSDKNRAQLNADRLERLWKEELKNKGPEKASFGWVILRFVRTRLILGGLTFIISVSFSFAAPAFVLLRFLQDLKKGDIDLGYGIALVLVISVMQFMRTMFFALGWICNYTTGVRVRGGSLSLLYRKILRLRGLKNKTVGELVNLCSNDGQRLFEACAIGPLLIGGPVILLYGVIYTVFLIGPWALVGSLTYIAFYPFMALISRMTAYFRRKGIAITDRRVRMMSELLTYIKLIKMYAWEESFSKKIAGIRSEERSILEKAAMVQGISTSSAPLVPVMAAVFVIVSHVLTGNDLTAAQAFTLIAIFNAMRFSLGVIPYAVRALAEAFVSFKRCKAFTLVAIHNTMKPVFGQLPGIIRSATTMYVSGQRFKAFTLIAVHYTLKPVIAQMPRGFRAGVHIIISSERFKAFTFFAIHNTMAQAFGQIPWIVHVITHLYVSSKRFQSVLLMEEIKPHASKTKNPNHMIVMKKACLRWDSEDVDADVKKIGLSDIEVKVQVNGKTKSGSKLMLDDEEKQKLKDREEDETSSDILPTLFDVDLILEKGKTIGVCGSVGCGKSSLISGILGRMVLMSGKVAVNGTVAYVAQQAWIMNASVKDNILFGQVYDEDRYNEVVKACCLEEDLKDFAKGDLTEIGERGINLSGGQKQRLSLARAVYANRDIYLLDDPLSAVDIHVGRHIFTECLMKCLKGKTILFVTHQLQYLSQCHGILVMKDGRIIESGEHKDLMSQDGEYANLISTFYSQDRHQEHEDGVASPPLSPMRERALSGSRERTYSGTRDRTFSASSAHSGAGAPNNVNRQISIMSAKSVVSNASEKAENAGKLIVSEEKAKGKVTAQVYWEYVKAAGGVIVTTFVMLIYLISVGTQSGTSWWLSYWLNQGSGNTTIEIVQGNETLYQPSTSIRDHPNMRFYAFIYGMGVVVIIITTVFRTFCFMKATLHASSKIHDTIFRKVLSCPMKFFDTTPVGRIINRFSADMDEIDVRLPGSAEVFLMNILTITFSLISICYVSPWFIIALVPLVICFVVLNVLFTSGVRELKRLDATTRSPLISHVTASVQGISTIHAFDKTEEFETTFYHLLDTNTVPFFLFYSSNRWLAVRLDLMSAIVIGVTGLLVLLTYDRLTPALAGMAMAFAIQMTGLFQFTIRLAIETEARFVSIERLTHYSKEVESEAPSIIKDKRPPPNWPNEGCISFKKYKMKYRENLPLALKGVTFDILPQEKIGIVGRSGSGKSSLGVGLFRLVEADSGSIEIDKIDIRTIGLDDLRSKLAIIPQDPVLFVGTVRYNLDPFSIYKDEEIWGALEKCHIKDTISMLELQLESPVVENGENFSVGERQLMCLARALLRHSKILVLDEATAAIDTETDSLVQATIKEAFHDCTMLIIAHRLNTVLSCNRIMVMEDGKVAEMGKPSSLMSNPKSKFKLMLEASENQEKELLT